MIGSVTTSCSFKQTTRYVSRKSSQQVYANFGAAMTDDVNQIAQQMHATAQQSDRVEKPCYHISISPSPKDDLTEQDWYDFTEDFLNEMGLGGKQTVGWLHHDATFPDGSPRPHLHLVTNRVGGLGQTYDTSWDYRKVDSALRRLEASYSLDSVPPASDVDVKRDTPGQVHRLAAEHARYENSNHTRSKLPQPSVRTQLQTVLDEAIAKTTSTDDIAKFLSQQGIETRISKRGWSFEKDGVHFAGSQLGRRYSMNSVKQMVNQPSQKQQAEQSDSEQLESRKQQRRLTMQEIMQESANAKEGTQQRQQSARSLASTGQRMMRDSEDIDGLTLIGGAVAAVGAAAELGEKFSQQLEQARAKANSKRAQEQIGKLENIGDRTTALENSLVQQRSQSANQTSPEQPTIFADSTSSPVEQSLNLANNRLTAIGEQLGVELEDVEPIELDPTAPTGKQLDQMDEAIVQLDNRLDALEGAIADLAQTPQPSVHSVEVAQSLENFTQARAQFRGETEPSAFISSAGIVALTSEGFQDQDSRLTITDQDYGTVFEAARPVDGSWETQINELQPEQVEKITQLPQSVEEYRQYKQGQEIIGSLQSLASKEFEGDRGQIDWSSPGSGFSYHFDIEQQASGPQQIVGRDVRSGDEIFSATISSDNDTFVTQNDIPELHSNELFKRREQGLTSVEESSPEANSQGITLGVQPRPTQQRELEL